MLASRTRRPLPVPLRVHGHQHDAVHVVRQHVVDIEPERAAGDLHELAEEAHDGLVPGIVAGRAGSCRRCATPCRPRTGLNTVSRSPPRRPRSPAAAGPRSDAPSSSPSSWSAAARRRCGTYGNAAARWAPQSASPAASVGEQPPGVADVHVHLRDQVVDRVELQRRPQPGDEVHRHVRAVQVQVVAIERVRLDGPFPPVEGRVRADRDRGRPALQLASRRCPAGPASPRRPRRPGSRCAAASRGSRSGNRAPGRAGARGRRRPRPGAAGRGRAPRPSTSPAASMARIPVEEIVTPFSVSSGTPSAVKSYFSPSSASSATSPAALCPNRKFSPTTTLRRVQPVDQHGADELVRARAGRTRA